MSKIFWNTTTEDMRFVKEFFIKQAKEIEQGWLK